VYNSVPGLVGSTVERLFVSDVVNPFLNRPQHMTINGWYNKSPMVGGIGPALGVQDNLRCQQMDVRGEARTGQTFVVETVHPETKRGSL